MKITIPKHIKKMVERIADEYEHIYEVESANKRNNEEVYWSIKTDNKTYINSECYLYLAQSAKKFREELDKQETEFFKENDEYVLKKKIVFYIKNYFCDLPAGSCYRVEKEVFCEEQLESALKKKRFKKGVREEAKSIVSQMTLEEKAGLCSGKDFWRLKSVERLGIPEVMVCDGPNGLRKQREDSENINDSIEAVCFPGSCAEAASFDRETMYRAGQAMGNACQAEHISILLGPGTNIKRSPICGRNFEYYSEDPLVAGKSGAAMVRGIQSRHIGASVKHFACNNKETNRKDSDSRVSERALREIYLKAFEIIVKEAAPYTIMSSYNLINGVQASENKDILTGILREEWGYQGMVTTDWWTLGEHYRETKAGNDIKMANGYPERVKEALDQGYISREEIEICAKRILQMILKVD